MHRFHRYSLYSICWGYWEIFHSHLHRKRCFVDWCLWL